MKKAAKSEKKRRGKIIPAVGVGLMTLTSTACASMRAADANTEVRSTNVLMAEEEVSDVSLATFHVFDKEGPVRLAAGHGCGGGGGGCGHGGGCGDHVRDVVAVAANEVNRPGSAGGCLV